MILFLFLFFIRDILSNVHAALFHKKYSRIYCACYIPQSNALDLTEYNINQNFNEIKISIKNTTFTFNCINLSDAFIQSDLQMRNTISDSL